MRRTAPSLDDLLAYQHSLGLTAHRRSASECRGLVPALSPTLRGGIEVPGDHQVDNRALLRALVRACRRAGVVFVATSVARRRAAGPSSSWRTVAPRCRAGRVGGRHRPGLHRWPRPGRPAPTAPGQGACPAPGSRCRWGASLLTRTVRGLVRGHSVYLVPRPDGSVVVGATVEERADTTVQAGAVHELLCDARALVPGIDELELLEASAGLRPATPDNTPLYRVDRARRGGGGHGPLPQRHSAGAPDRGDGGRPVGRRGGGRRRRQGGRGGQVGWSGEVSTVALTVNGDAVEVAAGSTIADLVAALTEGDDPKGVAVAVDRCVVPRSEWASTPARAGSLVEVVTAAAGG